MDTVSTLFYELLGEDPKALELALFELKRTWQAQRDHRNHALFNNEHFQSWLNEIISDGGVLTAVDNMKQAMDAYLKEDANE